MNERLIQRISNNVVRWRIVPALDEMFTGAVGDNFLEIFEREEFRIKDNSARTIVCLPAPGGGGVIVKKYKIRSPIVALQHHLERSQAYKEWRNLLTAKDRGLPVPEPVAFGLGDRCAYVAIVEAPAAKPLIEALREKGGADEETIGRLAALAADIHEAGLAHRDLHLGNFLVSGDGALALIDLHRGRFSKRIGRRAAAEDVGQILYSLSLVGGGENCARLLAEYVKRRSSLGEDFSTEAIAAAERWGARHARSRTRRCLEGSSDFAVERLGRARVYRRRDFAGDIAAILDGHSETLSRGGSDVLKDSPKSRLSIQGGFVVKEHTARIARRARLRREWRGGNGMIFYGMKTPRPLALVEDGPAWRRRCRLVSEFLEGAKPLDAYLRDAFDGESAGPRAEKVRLLRALAGEIKKLHAKGIFHKDMKANNIMVRDEEGRSAFYFLDLDRVRFGKKLRASEIAASLAALNAAVPNFITLSDRMLFFREYRGKGRLDKKDRALARKIVRLSIERNHYWRPKYQ